MASLDEALVALALYVVEIDVDLAKAEDRIQEIVTEMANLVTHQQMALELEKITKRQDDADTELEEKCCGRSREPEQR